MIINKNINIKKLLFFILAFTTLFLSFQFDTFRAVNHQYFKQYKFDSEKLIVSRMVNSRQLGIFDKGGLFSFCTIKALPSKTEYETLVNALSNGLGKGHSPLSCYLYPSSVGFQGVIFSTINAVIYKTGILPPKIRLKFYHGLNSAALAGAIIAIFLLLYAEVGLVSVLFPLLFLAFCQDIVAVASNLYWCFWSLMVPVAVVFYFLKKEETTGHLKWKRFLIIIGVLAGLKASFGYEFLTTATFATLSPIIYFWVKNSWGWKKAVKRLLMLGLICIIGTIVTMVLFLIQMSLVNHQSIKHAFLVQWHHALERLTSTIFPELLRPLWEGASQARLSTIWHLYWNSEAINLGEIFHFDGFYTIKYSSLICTFAFVSILGFFLKKFIEKRQWRVLLGLIAITWFSLLAPLSWFIVSRVHAYVHTFIDGVLWSTPFMLFGMLLLGYVVTLVLKEISVRAKIVFILVSIVSYFGFSYWNTYQLNSLLTQAQNNGTVVENKKQGMTTYYYKDQLIFYKKNCTRSDIDGRYLIHGFVNKAVMRKYWLRKGLLEADFNARTYVERGTAWPFNLNGSCVIRKPLAKGVKFSELRFGQARLIQGRLAQWKWLFKDIVWTNNMTFPSDYTPKVLTTVPINRSDSRWGNGISVPINRKDSSLVNDSPVQEAGFIMNRTALNHAIYPGDELIFADAGKRQVMKVIYEGVDIHVYVSGPKLDPKKDGYPHVIKIIPIPKKDIRQNHNLLIPRVWQYTWPAGDWSNGVSKHSACIILVRNILAPRKVGQVISFPYSGKREIISIRPNVSSLLRTVCVAGGPLDPLKDNPMW